MEVVVLLENSELITFQNTFKFIKEKLNNNKIVVIAKENLKKEIYKIDKDIRFVNEDFLYENLCLERVRKEVKEICGIERRAGWYFQQFLKMAYAFRCEEKDYLIWDSDTVPTKAVQVYADDKIPYLDYKKAVKYDEEYFRTLSVLFPDMQLNRKNVSFITEHMLINVQIMKELINTIEKNEKIKGKIFWEKILNAVRCEALNLSGYSEFETYAAYVLNYYPNEYKLRQWINLRNGKFYFGLNISEKHLWWICNIFDAVSIEGFDKNVKLITWLCDSFLDRGWTFRNIYQCVNPIYDLIFAVMLKIRDIKRKRQCIRHMVW